MEFCIKGIFLDVGGVLLTNGWDGALRKKVCAHFRLNPEEVEKRHHLYFDTFESGKIPFDVYLQAAIFFQPRDFTLQEVKEFTFAQAAAYPEMIAFCKELKQSGLKIGVVSNEGKELARDRVERFNLREFIDFFIFSGFVHLRKPDPDIYRLALAVGQFEPHEVIYIDDREPLIQAAAALGIRGITHVSKDMTQKELERLCG